MESSQPAVQILMKSLLIFTLLLVSPALMGAPSCQGNSATDLIATGIASFANDHTGLRQKCYTAHIDFLDGYRRGQVVAAPASFDGCNANIATDFSVQAGFKNSNSDISIIFLANNDNSWRSVEVFYLVTARDDLWVGSYTPNAFPLLGCWRNERRSAILEGAVNGLQNKYSLNAVVFISSLRSEAIGLTLDLKGATVNSSTGTIQVEVFSSASIEVIQISYIIYSQNIPFEVTTYASLSDLEHARHATYGFIGLNQFTQFGVNYLGIAFNSRGLICSGTGCSQDCVDIDLCKRLGGTINQKYCFVCKAGESLINYQCQTPCKPDEIFVNGACQCKNGFVSVGGVCKKICAENAYYYDSQRCVCLPGFYVSGSKCVLIPSCQQNEKFNGAACVCLEGYFRNSNGQCVNIPTCRDNQLFDGKQCVCKPNHWRNSLGVCVPVPKCGLNEILNQHQVCVCRDGFIRDQFNLCRQKCEEYALIVDGSCQCLPGFFRPEAWSKCQQIPTCGPCEVLSGNKCICADGYVRVGANCVKCGENQIYQNGECVCKPWYVRRNGVCVYEKPCQENEIAVNGICVCKSGYTKDSYNRCVISCPNSDEVWSPTIGCCICKHENFAKINGVCQACPAYSKPNDKKDRCDCLPGYIFEPKCGKCFVEPRCPPNSIVVGTPEGFICVCNDGFIKTAEGTCQSCGPYSHPNFAKTECVCDDGYQWEAAWGKCMQIVTPSCPPRSSWNPQLLRCECKLSNEHLIGNECRACSYNEGWNGEACVCQTGYFKINGVCRTCDPNTNYNGQDCVCNLGYYGNRDKCLSCHSTCGTCSGPSENECLTCTDVSYTFSNGRCTRDGPCPVGLFYNNKLQTCKPCSSYCSSCQAEEFCDQCIEGFRKETLQQSNKCIASYCVEKCGDGKRFELECDDGNLIDGDGCNSKCEVEKGWTCSGGSSIKPSTCASFIPDRSYINPTKAVQLFGKVVHGVRLSYIPKTLTQNECLYCNKLLWVKVIKSDIVPGVRVSYIPKSTYQFYIEFDFNGTFSIPVFTFSIQINPDYAQYFSKEDMAQIKVLTVDPAVLKKAEKVATLSLDDDEQDLGLSADAQAYLNAT